MPECDICGRITEKQYVVSVEGATMYACQKCSKGMSVSEVIGDEPSVQQRSYQAKHSETDSGPEIIEGYGDIIKDAREKLGWTNHDLALKINEKESLVARIERNGMEPAPEVAKKLEKALGIKLSTAEKEAGQYQKQKSNMPFTIGETAIRKDDKR